MQFSNSSFQTCPISSDSAVGSTEVNPQWAQPRQHRVLVVEDVAFNQKVVAKMLQKLGYGVDVAHDGQDALEALHRQPYDIVLMDVQMPRMDGLESSRQICQTWPASSRPWIIAMTAHDQSDDRAMCLTAGMNDYISKPIQFDALSKVLALAPCHHPHAMSRPNISAPPTHRSQSETMSPALTSDQPALERAIALLPTLDTDILYGLRSLMMDEQDDVLTPVIESYLDDAPKRLQAIRGAIAQQDADKLRKAAHALRSLSATVGATAFSRRCEVMETLAPQGIPDNADELLSQMEQESQQVAIALQSVLKTVLKTASNCSPL